MRSSVLLAIYIADVCVLVCLCVCGVHCEHSNFYVCIIHLIRLHQSACARLAGFDIVYRTTVHVVVDFISVLHCDW